MEGFRVETSKVRDGFWKTLRVDVCLVSKGLEPLVDLVKELK